ncbi:uncharacterized protein EI90DRAFT_1577588 [Cantharellus anzutake]|uniref:uncharacterized protein n=1 Tax=Cantharellus anzutake TaxID=1750568 RepID=UPI0019067C1E|nr:uncharacterized protein EI90DRAFT_1577588 [Cantharellus anzutake]KAF8328440.1 hypothetical protein EI90DRAFT_1577588 [Cantharellus anzutake]
MTRRPSEPDRTWGQWRQPSGQRWWPSGWLWGSESGIIRPPQTIEVPRIVRRYIIRGDDSNKYCCFGQVSYDKMGVLGSPCSFIYFKDLLQWLVSLFPGRPRRWTVVKQSLHILVTYKVINAPTSDPLLHCCSTQPVHSDSPRRHCKGTSCIPRDLV